MPFWSGWRLFYGSSIGKCKVNCLKSDPLVSDMEFLGQPFLKVRVASNKPRALLSARLVDEFPTGECTLISWGVLNLTHRGSHEYPQDLEVGTFYDVKINLDVIGQKISAGHQLILALSPTDWPQAWPSIETPTLEVNVEYSYLSLPVLTVPTSPVVKFDPPEIVQPIDRKILRGESRRRRVIFDVMTDEWLIDDFSDEGKRMLPDTSNGIEMGSKNWNKWSIKRGDSLSAYTESSWELTIGRGDWRTELRCFSSMRSDELNFYLYNQIEAFEGTGDKSKVFERKFNDVIPRDFQ